MNEVKDLLTTCWYTGYVERKLEELKASSGGYKNTI